MRFPGDVGKAAERIVGLLLGPGSGEWPEKVVGSGFGAGAGEKEGGEMRGGGKGERGGKGGAKLPTRITLGDDGYAYLKATFEGRLAELEEWKEWIVGTGAQAASGAN